MSDLEAFRAQTRNWLEANCPAEMRKPMRSEKDACWGGRHFEFQSPAQEQWLRAMGEKGWTVPDWPAAYGGGGGSSFWVGSSSDYISNLVVEEAAAAAAVLPKEAVAVLGALAMPQPLKLRRSSCCRSRHWCCHCHCHCRPRSCHAALRFHLPLPCPCASCAC